MVPGGGQPTVAARQVVGVSGHAADAPALASLDGGEALDLYATAWSSADRQGASSADRSLSAGESAVGLSAHCGRAERRRHCVSATTVKKILREEQLGPAGKRKGPSWREFLRAQATSVVGVDFFAVDTVWLQRLYVLFFIEVASRRVHLAGCTAHPDTEWVTQQARQVTWTFAERAEPVRFLIRDHDRKFTSGFDAVFEAENIRFVRTPIQVPDANGIAERFVRTARSECLDWLLILNARHLERALTVFVPWIELDVLHVVRVVCNTV
jgi:hypothetical protein